MENNSNNRQTSPSASAGVTNNTSENINTGLNRFSYADFILLSSTISYAIAEEVNVEDLEILITFLGMISGDLALLLIKKGRLLSNQAAQNTSIEMASDDISKDIESTLVRKPIHRKKNKIKRKIKKLRKNKNI